MRRLFENKELASNNAKTMIRNNSCLVENRGLKIFPLFNFIRY